MKTTKKTAVALLIALVLTITASMAMADAVKVSVQHVNSNESSWEVGLEEMVALVNEKSEGAYDVELFGNGVLCQKNPTIMLEMLQSGAGQLCMESVTSLVSLVPELFGINMPFIFQDGDHMTRFINSNPQILKDWKSKFEDIGLVVLKMIPRDFRQISNKNKNIKTLEDIKGQKYRVPNNPWYVKTFECFGAKPVPIASSEIYTAIQLGTVVGEDNSIPVVYDWKFFEVEPYMTVWNYMGDGSMVLANKEFWDGLSAEDQALFMEGIDKACATVVDIDVSYAKEAREKMEEAGVVFYEMTEEEKEPFRAAVAPLYAEFAEQIGQENWEQFLEAVDATRE